MADSDTTQHRGALLKQLFYLAFFCYPLVTPIVISIFDCRTIDSVAYIDADYTLPCAGSDYALAATWATDSPPGRPPLRRGKGGLPAPRWTSSAEALA